MKLSVLPLVPWNLVRTLPLAAILFSCGESASTPPASVGASVGGTSNGGSVGSGAAGTPDGARLDLFSFYVISVDAILAEAGQSELRSKVGKSQLTKLVAGLGGNLRGRAGADAMCQRHAEKVGSTGRIWRAFLSVTSDNDGTGNNAIGRVGQGPWYNIKGLLLAKDVAGLLHVRPDGDTSIVYDGNTASFPTTGSGGGVGQLPAFPSMAGTGLGMPPGSAGDSGQPSGRSPLAGAPGGFLPLDAGGNGALLPHPGGGQPGTVSTASAGWPFNQCLTDEFGNCVLSYGDSHDTLTGSNEQGQLYGTDPKYTCNDWTTDLDPEGCSGQECAPAVGHTWPRQLNSTDTNDAGWMYAHMSGGCSPAINLGTSNEGTGVGAHGGYGGFYCFAIN